ncbi:ORF6C domain-containing protein [Clostridium sp. HBUAS56010]|uniref:ORF6N domain-containing protein n=1 Tax=Clostridium sp. HBUAS56010 TaxID=2571127 RepID=UPI00163DCBD8|nr:ORF6C domain-containing protein [Clostridium sp. HBUAS56010]
MEEIVKVGNSDLQIKTWNGQRVITLKDIDQVHERPEGTAKRNFGENKKHLVLDEDYFLVTRKELSTKIVPNDEPLKGNPYIEVVLLTESGYLLLVKSFTDDLAWQVQRDLVKTYFKFQEEVQDFNENYPINTNELNAFLMEIKKNLPCMFVQINSIEEQLESVIENMTLSTRQQERIHEAARKRVNYLLGGAHSQQYKRDARSYMINLWNGLKTKFHCGSSYKDLHPQEFDKAIQYINEWKYD